MIEIDFSQFPPEVRELLHTVQFSLDVKAFVEGAVGQYLIGRAEQEKQAALELLGEADASDANYVRELQLVVRRAASFRDWLDEAIQAGKAAEAELQSQEGE
jgi:uncharacterized protein YhdP